MNCPERPRTPTSTVLVGQRRLVGPVSPTEPSRGKVVADGIVTAQVEGVIEMGPQMATSPVTTLGVEFLRSYTLNPMATWPTGQMRGL
jgi:hypothetical protein